jgi:5,6,7,8-tetrahydromethanopterin hydro-lyase
MSLTRDQLDGRIGEAWAGDVPNGSHVNLVVACRGSHTFAALAAAVVSTTPGHAPVLACLGAGNLVRPATLIKNKATIESDRLGRITWGAAQLGIGQGVLDAVEAGAFAGIAVDDVALLVALWVDPEASDETAVRLSNRAAMRAAIADALADPAQRAAQAERMLALRETERNAFYSGD